MSNLKEIRSRIASVKSTQQITSAMKMVSAAKLRKTQAAILKLRPYSKKMNDILSKLGSTSMEDIPYACKRENSTQVLIIALTGNKGLCSTFNSSIIKLTIKQVKSYISQGKQVSVLSFGKKGDVAFKKLDRINYIHGDDEIWEKLDFTRVSKETQKIMNDFLSRKYDKVEIIYNQFKNAATQIPVIENFLPIQFEDKQEVKQKQEYGRGQRLNDYIFEPNKQAILQNIIPQTLHTQMYKCFLDSLTSEHGARMSSMNKATDNAQNLLRELTLTYNKQRQSDITNQIIEVCNGANAI